MVRKSQRSRSDKPANPMRSSPTTDAPITTLYKMSSATADSTSPQEQDTKPQLVEKIPEQNYLDAPLWRHRPWKPFFPTYFPNPADKPEWWTPTSKSTPHLSYEEILANPSVAFHKVFFKMYYPVTLTPFSPLAQKENENENHSPTTTTPTTTEVFTFTRFSDFPKDIRLNIWEQVACNDPKVIDIWTHFKLGLKIMEAYDIPHYPAEYLKYMTSSTATQVPSLLHVCHEARTIGLQYYTSEVGSKGAFNLPTDMKRVVTPRIWVNWQVDALLLGTTAESYRGRIPWIRKEDWSMFLHVDMVLKSMPRGTVKLAIRYCDVDLIHQMGFVEYAEEIWVYRYSKSALPKRIPALVTSHPISAYTLFLPPCNLQLARVQPTEKMLHARSALERLMERREGDWKRPPIKFVVWGPEDEDEEIWDLELDVDLLDLRDDGWAGLLVGIGPEKKTDSESEDESDSEFSSDDGSWEGWGDIVLKVYDT